MLQGGYMLIFEESKASRKSQAHILQGEVDLADISQYLRQAALELPEVSELQVVRHYSCLSKKNFAIDSHFYPLGSCTMKYNPKVAHRLASLPEFLARHPYAPLSHSQGFMSCLFELQNMLKTLTGMPGVCLTPMAGAQGELAGVLMIRAYHKMRNDLERSEMLVPDSAHGTNPASAVMAGFTIREIPTNDEGDLDLDALRQALGPKTAGLMLTNPSTLGLFERQIKLVSELVHNAGGLLYYDGANLNAILGIVRPGDMGFDVMHLNLHKTFATPHGSGGPGSGPIAVAESLLPYLPLPLVLKENNQYRWSTLKEKPASIGQLSTFMGNAGILLRAYIYLRLLGLVGVKRVGTIASLNAHYLANLCRELGLNLAYPQRNATHEFLITFKAQAKQLGVTAKDFAKRLLDYGIHAPTTYFPLLVPECWLIEPTETESKETLDHFIAVLKKILQEAKETPDLLKTAPHTLPVTRLDEVKAARVIDVNYYAWGKKQQ